MSLFDNPSIWVILVLPLWICCCFLTLADGLLLSVLRVIRACVLGMDVCECYVIETVPLLCLFQHRRLGQTSVARSVSRAAGGCARLSPVLLSLADVLGFCPVQLWFRVSWSPGRASSRTWALHVWLSSSWCLWLPWSPCPPVPMNRKPWV